MNYQKKRKEIIKNVQIFKRKVTRMFRFSLLDVSIFNLPFGRYTLFFISNPLISNEGLKTFRFFYHKHIRKISNSCLW